MFLLISIVIGIRIYVEATHYLSPDSHFYLCVADNILEGKGFIGPREYPFDEKTENDYFALWPIGYSLMIVGTSFVAGTSTFLASKIVNIIFLAFSFILFYRWFGEKAWFPALYYCSYGMLEVYSYTWSEGVFLFFVLYLCYRLYKSFFSFNKLLFLDIFFCLSMLVALRYAGLIYFFFVAILLFYFLYKRKYNISVHLFGGLLLSSLVVGAYFYMNFLKTGYYTGGYRYYPEVEPYCFFIKKLFQGIINEFTIVRNYYFSGYQDCYYVFFLFLQLVLITFLYRNRSLLSVSYFGKTSPSRILIFSGIFYFVFIVLLRKISPFDFFDYRILAPFSMPIFIGILSCITLKEHHLFFIKTYKWIASFMLLSLFFNLPKAFLLERLLRLL